MATIDCAASLADVANDPCNYEQLGKQIVWLAVQSMRGTPFAANANLNLAATWTTKINATNDDKITIIPALVASSIPEGTPELLQDNDVPFGGQQLEDIVNTFTARAKFLSLQDYENIMKWNNLGQVRVWMIDDKYYLRGGVNGIENASVVVLNPTAPGQGAGNYVYVPLTVTWRDKGGYKIIKVSRDIYNLRGASTLTTAAPTTTVTP
ncbi:MAG: hypothetical protein ACRCVT_10050 [Leadbetterella sp.]